MEFIDNQMKQPRDTLSVDSARTEEKAYPPDLLSFPARGGQASPAASTASTAPDSSRLLPQSQSPLHSPIYSTNPNLFKTLPYSRSQSPFTSPVCPPIIAPRQGYVTIPRRPRVPSWSSTTSSLLSPVLPGGEIVEPVYDNLGLRTTADGSSVLSLNKTGLETPQYPATMRGRPLPATPTTMYAPIKEHEQPPSPAPQTPYNSTLSRLNSNSLQLQLSPNVAEPQEPIYSKQLKNKDGVNNHLSPISPLVNGRLYDSISNSGTLGRSGKIPPRPPPKPTKKSPSQTNGPLFEDEGEDGTEV